MFQILTSPVDTALVWRARGAAAAPAIPGRLWGFRILTGRVGSAAIVFPRPTGSSGGTVATISGAGGIASGEAFGTPTVAPVIPQTATLSGAGGIASGEAWGLPSITVQRPNTPAPSASTVNNPDSILSGMTTLELQSALVSARRAYTQLMSGEKIVSASYSQGDGARSVTYTQANLAQLTAYIRQLQVALGMTTSARRPARFIFK